MSPLGRTNCVTEFISSGPNERENDTRGMSDSLEWTRTSPDPSGLGVPNGELPADGKQHLTLPLPTVRCKHPHLSTPLLFQGKKSPNYRPLPCVTDTKDSAVTSEAGCCGYMSVSRNKSINGKSPRLKEPQGRKDLQMSFACSGTFKCPSKRKSSYSGQSRGRGIEGPSDGTLVAQASAAGGRQD